MTVTNQTETRRIQVLRTPLHGFPDVIIHATETAVKKHPRYNEAKSGDSEAAFELVQATINDGQVENLRILLSGRKPLLASAHAYEAEGVNAISRHRAARSSVQ